MEQQPADIEALIRVARPLDRPLLVRRPQILDQALIALQKGFGMQLTKVKRALVFGSPDTLQV
jgi:hypothetical protein